MFCHHMASLVMPNGDPQEGSFDPTPTLKIDSYITWQIFNIDSGVPKTFLLFDIMEVI